MDFLPTLLQTIAFVPSLSAELKDCSATGRAAKKRRCVVIPTSGFVYNQLGRHSTNRRSGEIQGRPGKGIDGAVECLNASVWAKAK